MTPLRLALCLTVALALFAASALAEPGPREIAGLAVGQNIEAYKNRLDLSKAVALWDKPYLNRVNVRPTKGFRAGYVLYGNCAQPGRVTRVKFKYKLSSLAEFEKLTKAMVERYGKAEPLADWSENARGYRWIFGPKKSKGVDVLLEYYVGADPESEDGITIRLTDNMALAEEQACYAAGRQKEPESEPAFPLFEVGPEWLLPR